MSIPRRKRATGNGERKPSSWRDVLPIHPAAELLPRMLDDDLRELGEDIKKNDLRAAVAVWKEQKHLPVQLLDGRSRLDAMEAVGIKIKIESSGTDADPQIRLSYRRSDLWMPIKVVELRGDHGDDPDTYVISTNIRRRHLNHKQREEAFAKIIARAPEKSDRQIAREIGVDHKTIGRARAKGEDVGSIPHVPTRTDSKGRRQPARKPERRTVPAESQKGAARQVAKRVAGAIVESETNEVARLRARVQELEAEVDQLKRENLGLQSELDELRARLDVRRPRRRRNQH
jgi:hypothetical protein